MLLNYYLIVIIMVYDISFFPLTKCVWHGINYPKLKAFSQTVSITETDFHQKGGERRKKSGRIKK
jgi:hypothetical protein